ncbi:MAG TPA: hypothetical protein VEC57_15870 [Candidatus Limnocylindrales bacterium]|nr:hypothetical protein [Candidatus Limnocylindrales bacterium]
MAHRTSFIFKAVAGIAVVAATASGAMAAGNVNVSVFQGQLTISGDSADNDVTISGTASPSRYLVTGNNGTTVNGMGAPVTTDVANREVFIEMLSGSDTVSIVNATITRTVEITFGNGTNSLSMNNVVMNKNLKLIMGLGTNSINFVDTEITEPSKITTDDGMDTIEFDNVEFRGGIFTKDGNDIVTILNSHHVDPKGKLVVKTGNDQDDIEITNADWEGKMLINAGTGNDLVTAGTIDVGVKAKITGAGDTDTLTNNGGHVGIVEFSAFE